jgi:hypothetical protein
MDVIENTPSKLFAVFMGANAQHLAVGNCMVGWVVQTRTAVR